MSFWARIDSNSANNPALNLTGDAAIEIEFLAETATGDPGDRLLDTSVDGPDPDTVVLIGGTTYSFSFEYSAELPTLNRDGAQQVPDQYEGSEVVVITVHDYPTAGESTRLFFMQGELATEAEMNGFGKGAIDVQALDTTPQPTTICFAEGSRILTSRGYVAVENLRPGDLVETLDDGPRPIRWVGQSELNWPGAIEGQKPIHISAGALGVNRPRQDLVVSPQHRMLLSNVPTDMGHGLNEVLAPAIALTGLPGIRQMKGKRSVTYFHVLLDHHAVIQSEDVATESFYPGPQALKMLSRAQRAEVLMMFPALRGDPEGGYGLKARPVLTRREAQALLALQPGPNGALRLFRNPQAPSATPMVQQADQLV